MEQILVEVNYRERTGKEYARKLRSKGFVPAILYGKGFEPVALELGVKDIQKILHSESGGNAILNLKVKKNGGEEAHLAMITDIQKDILQKHYVHVDLHKISLDEKVHATVKLILRGEARGVKEGGGMLEQLLWEIEVSAKPMEMPRHIEVDISNVDLGRHLAIRDLTLPEGVEVLNEPHENILVVSATREEVIATELPAAAAAPAAEAAKSE